MPQNPTTVYSVDDGTPCVMHSVDAKEAVALGDYSFTAPSEPDPKALAAAQARFKGMNAEAHPELMSQEQRDTLRAAANERAAQFPEVPPGTTVAVMAPARGGAGSASPAGGGSAAPEASPARRSGPASERTP